MITDASLRFLGESGRRYVLATRRGESVELQAKLGREGWKRLPKTPQAEVILFKRKDVHYPLARSQPRRKKERAIRRRQRCGLERDLKRLCALIGNASGGHPTWYCRPLAAHAAGELAASLTAGSIATGWRWSRSANLMLITLNFRLQACC
jgi:hypothetical protein